MSPHTVAVNCARAVEGIRHLIAGEGERPEVAWPLMRESLNVDRAYLEFITSSSTKNRHGHREMLKSLTAREIMKRSWILMDRYLHFLKRSGVPLTEPEFPMLAG